MTGPRGATVQNWRALVEVEHCDRIKRLQRISAQLPEAERPLFFDGTILADRLPRNVGVDMPILRVVFPERIFFDTDSDALRPAALEVARLVAASLQREAPDAVMFVAGHADARASRSHNADLSVRRANSLAEAVLARDVNVATVWRVGFGEDLPLIAGDSDHAHGQNRRVEFLFASRPEALAVWLSDNQVDQLCQGRSAAETDRCRGALRFADRYEVVQVAHAPRTAVRPEQTGRRTTKPAGPTRGSANPRATHRASNPQSTPQRSIAAGRAGQGTAAPQGSGQQQLNLRRAPRIALDLTRRRATRLYE